MAQRPSGTVATSKRFARERVKLVDLDQRPELISATVAAFAACPPGKHHLVCGLPASMGQVPTTLDLMHTSGVMLACSATDLLGAIALCPYSDEQVTLWGPAVCGDGLDNLTIPERLLNEARKALKDSGYISVRTLVDQRNRELRSFLLAHGFSAWKDNVIFERYLRGDLPGDSQVRPTTAKDHNAVSALIAEAFPETGHLAPSLATRELEGYRHYVLTGPSGLLGAAAIAGDGRRSWMKLIAISAKQRSKGLGHRLVAGVVAAEAARGVTHLGLEVLADNLAAVALYTGTGFKKQFTAAIMTAPL